MTAVALSHGLDDRDEDGEQLRLSTGEGSRPSAGSIRDVPRYQITDGVPGWAAHAAPPRGGRRAVVIPANGVFPARQKLGQRRPPILEARRFYTAPTCPSCRGGALDIRAAFHSKTTAAASRGTADRRATCNRNGPHS